MSCHQTKNNFPTFRDSYFFRNHLQRVLSRGIPDENQTQASRRKYFARMAGEWSEFVEKKLFACKFRCRTKLWYFYCHFSFVICPQTYFTFSQMPCRDSCIVTQQRNGKAETKIYGCLFWGRDLEQNKRKRQIGTNKPLGPRELRIKTNLCENTRRRVKNTTGALFWLNSINGDKVQQLSSKDYDDNRQLTPIHAY